jgi:putative spermidine/putrescine transport system substrate-binding protein
MERRSFLLGSTAAGLALATGMTGRARAAGGEIVVSGSGGVVAEANAKYFMPAFEKETGWTVRQVSAEASRMAEIEAMVRSGNALWDVSEISATDYPISIEKNLLEPIDYKLVDPDNKLPTVARQKFGVGAASYSTVLVQRMDKLPEGKKMTSWADFWDVDTFPGPRSLRRRPEYNLEFALIADGVSKDDVYNVLADDDGVERAFSKLDEIKGHIPSWWNSGAQSIQLLSDGEAFFSTTYNGRITTLQKSGIPAEIVWNGGALHTSYVGIIKGSKHLEKAHEYVRIRTARADLERQYLTAVPYPNFAPGLFDEMPKDMAEQMPTYPQNAAMQFSANEEFWAKRIDHVQERWDEWLLE